MIRSAPLFACPLLLFAQVARPPVNAIAGSRGRATLPFVLPRLRLMKFRISRPIRFCRTNRAPADLQMH